MKDQLGGSFLFASINFPERPCLLLLPKSLTIFNTTKKTWGRNIPFPDAGSHLLDLVKSMTDIVLYLKRRSQLVRSQVSTWRLSP